MWDFLKRENLEQCEKKCGGGAENSIAMLFDYKFLPSAERQMTDK